jgi:hypothetical protein
MVSGFTDIEYTFTGQSYTVNQKDTEDLTVAVHNPRTISRTAGNLYGNRKYRNPYPVTVQRR